MQRYPTLIRFKDCTFNDKLLTNEKFKSSMDYRVFLCILFEYNSLLIKDLK